MSLNAVNGRDSLFADWFAGPVTELSELRLVHTMGSPSPSFHTMPSPVYATQPAPTSGAAAATVVSATSTTASTEPPPSDDLFDAQWHFDFLGDIQKIWEEFTGADVHVGIYDDGLQSDHPDLDGNYDASRELTLFIYGEEHLDPRQPIEWYGYPHGTSVAGLIAAERNGVGTVGVAYGSSITGIPIFSGTADINYSFDGFIEALGHANEFDIISNSWGATAAFYQSSIPYNDQINAGWMHAVEEGRVDEEGNKLGTVIVKAAGNDNLNTNGDQANTTRATIIVGAYDATGDASYYSSFGANLLVSAPSSGDRLAFLSPPDAHIDPGIVTTDLTVGGYDMSTGEFDEPSNYTDQFGGTSAATPIVSGVVALMLDANADLGWRDVQNILAYSAREIGSGVGGAATSSEEHKWLYNNAGNWNGGGLHFSNDYGYGSVDAYNAVRMAEVWGLFAAPQVSANETSISASLAAPQVIADLTHTDLKFVFSEDDFDVDYVNVDINITHDSPLLAVFTDLGIIYSVIEKSLSDIKIELISPDGTVVELADFTKDISIENGSFGLQLQFGANGFRGEDASGTWTLRVTDAWGGNADGMINSATVTIHGRDGTQAGNDLDNDVYHYTNEVFTTLGRDASRLIITDTDGGVDWLDLAAVSGDVVVRLTAGETSTGTSSTGVHDIIKIAAGTVIENAVTGDGNDKVFGNDAANALYGMRGNDTLEGGAGGDTLSGGAGNDTLTGGAGLDFFLFDRALNGLTNVDIIVDFSHLDDAIQLDATIFAGLSLGTLSAEAFYAGTSAQDELDRIIYDQLTGALYFDADGSNSAFVAIQFATLLTLPADLSWDDFTVVSQQPGEVVAADDRTADAPTVVVSEVEENQAGSGTILGTEGRDQLRGDQSDNQIFGFAGEDIIVTGDGNNYVDAGADVDAVLGGRGNDVLIGGGSLEYYGDTIDGGAGDDVIIGSDNQINDEAWNSLFGYGDQLTGADGDDRLYGLNGDDSMGGGNGNDYLEGGNGSDGLYGHDGDDRLRAGLGKNNIASGGAGIDTVIFEGPSDEYRWYIADMIAPAFEDYAFYLRLERKTDTTQETTSIHGKDVEFLQFSDRTIDVSQDLVIATYGGVPLANAVEFYDDVNVVVDGYEVGVYVDKADTVTIVDTGDENGKADVLNAVLVEHAYGDVYIQSDVLGDLEVSVLGKYYFDASQSKWVIEPMQQTVKVDAAEGERHLRFETNGTNLGLHGKIIDDTATSVSFEARTYSSGQPVGEILNGAAVNDWNLSFEDATHISFDQLTGGASIKWNVPKALTIEVNFVQWGPIFDPDGVPQTLWGNQGWLTIETPLDDSVLATAGGDAGYSFTAKPNFTELSSAGREFVRFGNIGSGDPGGYDMSNDGTVGDEAHTNAGLGLQGSIDVGLGDDEVRILGSGAIKGNAIIDGGVSLNPLDGSPTEWNGDTLRMTFGVASAIGNISDHIQNFEILRLDTPTLTGLQAIDVTNFDSLNRLAIAAGTVAGGDNTITNLVAQSAVNFVSVSEAHEITPNNWGSYIFERYGNEFGTIHLDMAGDGANDEVTLRFIGLATDGVDNGTVHVSDAETVNISTLSLDMEYRDGIWDPNSPSGPVKPGLSVLPTDPFAQALQLDDATTVIVKGNTGWDFTVAGSDISKVTLLDATEVTGFGVVGGVTAFATASTGVTFKGGSGYDTFGGAAGPDTFDGGEGFDTVKFHGASTDYTFAIVEGALVVTDNRGASAVDGVDTLRNIERIEFDNGTFSTILGPNGELTGGAPVDIVLLQSDYLPENSATDTFVGTLTAYDPDSDDFEFSLVNPTGAYKIVGNQLLVDKGFKIDYEQVGSNPINNVMVQVKDLNDGTTYQKAVQVIISDVNPDIVTGDDDANTLVGNMLVDILDGRGGNDTLRGNAKGDILIGGGGDDQLRGDSGDDTAVFTGNRSDYTFLGNQFNLRVIDSVAGRDGTDTLSSIEFLQFADGTVTLAEFMNLPPTAVSLTNIMTSIAENTPTPERIKVADIVVADDAIGTNRLSLTGRDAAFFEIIGMALYLMAGTLLDYEQRQSLEVAVTVDDEGTAVNPDATSDTFVLAITDVAEANVINGTPGNNTLTGTSGDDYFDGHGGKDTFKGGRGNDTYVVDSSDDKVIEVSGQGTDTVLSSATKYTLAANVNNLTLTGTGNIDGTGNTSSNIILGNSGNNKLIGGAGNDTIDGGAGDDIMDGGTGTDTASYASAAGGVTVSLAIKTAQDTGGSGTDTIKNFENLSGSSHADTLAGNSSANILDGGADADDMTGGKGNDTYLVDSAADTVHELAKQGTDTVRSSAASYTLAANVENATLIGNGVEAVGNELANKLTGNGLANILTGGAGKDVFVFNAAPSEDNVDTITDFVVADDTIHIDNAAFASVGRNGALSFAAFTIGSEAHDRTDRIIYDKDTGALYYDADGSGSHDQVQFAHIDPSLALTYKDFYVV